MPDRLKLLALLLLAAALCAFTRPAIQRELEMLNPTVLVDLPGSTGSGTVVHSGEGGTLILTNHHVVGEALATVAGAQPRRKRPRSSPRARRRISRFCA